MPPSAAPIPRTNPFADPPSTQPSSAPLSSPRPTRQQLNRSETGMSMMSRQSIPPPGSILTGKQEHYLKRELISQQTNYEISELASPTALQRFGAPFKSDAGEVAPEDSELPLLRYIFVHHIRNFPFLDQAREKEFWQDKLQTHLIPMLSVQFLESFANKHISSSEDRLEETKRRKLATKAAKLVELMMVSGIPTASGYEERIRFSEMEVVDVGANEQGLVVNVPHGHEINGWDINVAGVRTTSVKRHMRYHQHAEFLIRVKRSGRPEQYVGRRYGEFQKMHKGLRLELPGKVLPPLPRKNKSHSLLSSHDDDADSVSSASTQGAPPAHDDSNSSSGGGLRSYLPFGGGHKRSASSRNSLNPSPRGSIDDSRESSHSTVLYREEQRVSLRAFLRTLLQNEQIAQSKTMADFFMGNPVRLNEEELGDVERRKEMDEKRVEEQRRFFEIARKRAEELEVHMEKFRRDIVESNGLSKLFKEIREKDKIADLKPEYKKFAEWLRIEVAATIYHLFLAEDNSPELFAQAKRIHSLVPYSALKQVIRYANPAAVVAGVLDLFLAQPFGARSLMQRIFGMALSDGMRAVQKSIDALIPKIDDPVLCAKVKSYTEADESVKNTLRREAQEDNIDLLVVVLRSEMFSPELTPEQIGKVFNGYVAWNNAVENVDEQMRQGAELFGRLKQLLKLYTRQRDKVMMLKIIEEPTTLQLFRDLFTIFYEPLVRVYKSANVYSSVTDFALFADDAIATIERSQRQDVSADPNQTVQSFIDLCARHEHAFYKFVHEVHIHDNGLFDQLMGWVEGILDFLRHGPHSGLKLDISALFQGAVDSGRIDKRTALREINALIRWQTARKRWHQDKTRQKMAAKGGGDTGSPAKSNSLDAGAAGAAGLASAFKPTDFGLDALDLEDLASESDDDDDDESESEDDGGGDVIAAERRRRRRQQERLRRTAGEPRKPEVLELRRLGEGFVAMLRMVLAE
ncbi:hypothetical protein B0A49_04030 [Cryomyces minteri]|uniref:PX domain-containing protein n=1 Tax=Cryomyces minteri TaxID=331657 RepID=A0A4U0XIH4_9PEZI|nr:hypothetical protein B0A49_04030 [Cryomyces minteri]